MNIIIRKERPDDHAKVFEVVKAVFKNEAFSDHDEHFLVERLRGSEAFIPELSIVAENENEVIGHILFTRIKIKNDNNAYVSLALAPVSVKPEFQGKGIGGLLITEGHKVAKSLGYKSVVVVGHEKYYPKFGYELAIKYRIQVPFDVPEENCMVISLTNDGLAGVNGEVEYPQEFFL